MIQFEAVSKAYGDVLALSDVSFTVHPGEVFGYIGPNGAGKTSSIKIMTGLVRDFTGSVIVDNTKMGAKNLRLPPTVGYLPQEAGFQEWRTVEHVLDTFGRLSGLTGNALSSRINHVLALTGIGEFRARKVVHLSGGTVQKLRLAQALLTDPKILVLDEPLSGLDPTSRFQVKSIIRSFAGTERVVFLSSHILSDVEDLATRIGILDRGKMKEMGSPDELRTRHQLGMVVEIVTTSAAARDAVSLPVQAIERTEPVGGETLRVHLKPDSDLDGTFHSILAALVENRVPLRSVRHLQPSLEDVYMRLTEVTG